MLKQKWIFKKRPLDDDGTTFLCKARCVARGDLQEPFIDYDPDSLYVPVAAHESFRMLLAFAANKYVILEKGDVANAYLYETSILHYSWNYRLTGIETHFGYVCELEKLFGKQKISGDPYSIIESFHGASRYLTLIFASNSYAMEAHLSSSPFSSTTCPSHGMTVG